MLASLRTSRGPVRQLLQQGSRELLLSIKQTLVLRVVRRSRRHLRRAVFDQVPADTHPAVRSGLPHLLLRLYGWIFTSWPRDVDLSPNGTSYP